MLRARAVRVRGAATYITGDFEEGNRWSEAALEAFRELGDDARAAHMLLRLAAEAHRAGDPAKARQLCEESLDLHPSKVAQAQLLDVLGRIAFEEGRGDDALGLLEQSATVAGQVGFRWWQSLALLNRGEYALRLSSPIVAGPSIREGLTIAREIGDRQWVAFGVTLFAWLAAAEGRMQEAGRLWGAVEAESRACADRPMGAGA